jgi:hypothetical protein
LNAHGQLEHRFVVGLAGIAGERAYAAGGSIAAAQQEPRGVLVDTASLCPSMLLLME